MFIRVLKWTAGVVILIIPLGIVLADGGDLFSFRKPPETFMSIVTMMWMIGPALLALRYVKEPADIWIPLVVFFSGMILSSCCYVPRGVSFRTDIWVWSWMIDTPPVGR